MVVVVAVVVVVVAVVVVVMVVIVLLCVTRLRVVATLLGGGRDTGGVCGVVYGSVVCSGDDCFSLLVLADVFFCCVWLLLPFMVYIILLGSF